MGRHVTPRQPPGDAAVQWPPLVAMTEDELLIGITEALTISGWRWTHIRQSNGITVGMSGLPDVVAVHPTRGLAIAWELKSETGQPTPDQLGWLHGFRGAGVDARLVRPSDYDVALDFILGR